MNVFCYDIDAIISNSKILSSYRSNSLLDRGNESNFDDTEASNEDDNLLKKYLKLGASMIADIVSGYTKDLLDVDGETELAAFEFNVAYKDVTSAIVFRVNMPDTFNQAISISIDEEIKDGIENYMLYRISKTKGIEYSSYQENYEESLGKIRSYINRRTESVKRSYGLL